MLKPSLEEYKLLRTDLAEIRDQITRYMGFIVTIIGGASVLAKVLSDGQLHAEGVIAVMMFTMLVVSLLFEIIWYKFRSHNRHAGYIQMLSHEIGLGPMGMAWMYGEPDGQKIYLDKLADQYYSVRDETGSEMIRFITRLNEVHSWEFVLSRYRRTIEADKTQSFRTMDKGKYSYVLGTRLRHKHFRMTKEGGYINGSKKPMDAPMYDIHFYQEIIARMVGRWKVNWLYRVGWGILTLVSKKRPKPLNSKAFPYGSNGRIAGKGYRFSGWNYPRMLTRVACIGVTAMLFFACYEAWPYPFAWYPNMPFNTANTLRIGIPILLMFLMFMVWLGRYAFGVIELEEGYESIDYYCWTFLPFRVQFLNGRGIIPLYFSRDFIRFMKSRMLHYELGLLAHCNGAANCANCKPANDASFYKVAGTIICDKCRSALMTCYEEHTEIPPGTLKYVHDGLSNEVFTRF